MFATMAQLVEQRIRNAWVTSSSLVIGSMMAQRKRNIVLLLSVNILFAFFLLGRQPDAIVAQLVEHKLPKLGVAGSNPVCRSTFIS